MSEKNKALAKAKASLASAKANVPSSSFGDHEDVKNIDKAKAPPPGGSAANKSGNKKTVAASKTLGKSKSTHQKAEDEDDKGEELITPKSGSRQSKGAAKVPTKKPTVKKQSLFSDHDDDADDQDKDDRATSSAKPPSKSQAKNSHKDKGVDHKNDDLPRDDDMGLSPDGADKSVPESPKGDGDDTPEDKDNSKEKRDQKDVDHNDKDEAQKDKDAEDHNGDQGDKASDDEDHDKQKAPMKRAKAKAKSATKKAKAAPKASTKREKAGNPESPDVSRQPSKRSKSQDVEGEEDEDDGYADPMEQDEPADDPIDEAELDEEAQAFENIERIKRNRQAKSIPLKKKAGNFFNTRTWCPNQRFETPEQAGNFEPNVCRSRHQNGVSSKDRQDRHKDFAHKQAPGMADYYTVWNDMTAAPPAAFGDWSKQMELWQKTMADKQDKKIVRAAAKILEAYDTHQNVAAQAQSIFLNAFTKEKILAVNVEVFGVHIVMEALFVICELHGLGSQTYVYGAFMQYDVEAGYLIAAFLRSTRGLAIPSPEKIAKVLGVQEVNIPSGALGAATSFLMDAYFNAVRAVPFQTSHVWRSFTDILTDYRGCVFRYIYNFARCGW